MKGSSPKRVAILAVLVTVGALFASCGEEADDNGSAAQAAPVPGVTATEIKLGTHMPLSRTPAAAYAPIADGMRAYFDYINDTEGGVYGRKIQLIVGDDHYTPADTVEVVRGLVEEDGVFAIVGGLGDAPHLAVWKYLEERQVPDLFISSGNQVWTDPVVKTRFGGYPSYIQEGEMLGQYVASNYDGKKLGLLIQNDSFGDDGEQGVRRGVEGSDVKIAAVEKYDAANLLADVTAQAQRLRNADVDVVVAYALPAQAASLIKTARQVLNWNVPVIVSGVDASEAFAQLAGVENAEGVVTVLFGHQTWETDHPGVQQFLQVMAKYAPAAPVENFAEYGYAGAELTVEALKRAGPDLTREGLIEALEKMRGYLCSLCFEPVSLSPTDHRPIEVEMYVKLHDGKWVPFGEPVSFESTPP